MLYRVLRLCDADHLNDYGMLLALELANAVHALLSRGADPTVRCTNLNLTPLEHWDGLWRCWVAHRWGPRSPVHDILEYAEDDVRSRQLALAMSQHPRLGASSSLLAMFGSNDDVFRSFVATSENCVASHNPRNSPQALYAMQLATVLAIEPPQASRSNDRPLPLQTFFQECVSAQTPLTRGLRKRMRALACANKRRRRAVSPEARHSAAISSNEEEEEEEEDVVDKDQ